MLRLNEVCDAKQRTLSEKKDALEQLAAITDHCVDFVTAALDQVRAGGRAGGRSGGLRPGTWGEA